MTKTEDSSDSPDLSLVVGVSVVRVVDVPGVTVEFVVASQLVVIVAVVWVLLIVVVVVGVLAEFEVRAGAREERTVQREIACWCSLGDRRSFATSKGPASR